MRPCGSLGEFPLPPLLIGEQLLQTLLFGRELLQPVVVWQWVSLSLQPLRHLPDHLVARLPVPPYCPTSCRSFPSSVAVATNRIDSLW